MTLRVLVLGGTAEARELATALDAQPGVTVITSLAGRTRHPRLPLGDVFTGGFGGVGGLAAALRPVDGPAVDVLVDATHPFAATMTKHAAAAAERTGTPLVVLRRPGWTAGPGDDWRRVASLAEAAGLVHGRVLLAVGRQGVSAFAARDDAWFLVRAIETPDVLPPCSELLLARGPFPLDDERALLERHRIDVVVAKDSGGPTDAKLVAARERGLPVVLVDRPPLPPGLAVHVSVAGVLTALERSSRIETCASAAEEIDKSTTAGLDAIRRLRGSGAG